MGAAFEEKDRFVNTEKGIVEGSRSVFGLPDNGRRNAVPGGTPISASERLTDRGIYGLDAADPRARPFILLRTQILNTLEARKVRCIAVTSPSASNGKSYVAANLATALCGVEDVCLVDLHLRRPVVAEWFETPDSSGVSGCLSGRGTLQEANFHIRSRRLNVFPAGAAQSDTTPLLTSGLLGTFMSQLRSLAGEPVCVIDCPPVLESDDMLLIAKHVDGVLLIAEEGSTTRDEISDSVRMLGTTPILGTLLNKSIVPKNFLG